MLRGELDDPAEADNDIADWLQMAEQRLQIAIQDALTAGEQANHRYR